MRIALFVCLLSTLCAAPAAAFCGFYVGGADASLYNDATMVVLMREGTTTVLSMQNTYTGPPEEFALVVPVPVVIEEENVRVLPQDIFARVDRLTAPRLVEYHEQDPCAPPAPVRMLAPTADLASVDMAMPEAEGASLGVTVEAEFAVGEYDIAILSATQSDGLETWLAQEGYNIPAGAAPVLDPYVQLGTKFFVAKVDPSRVTFENGRTVLSPLRVHYDSESLSLPIRLGMLNARGQQDLIVHVLAKNQRFEVANYPNVTIPTNLVVEESVAGNFGSFYRSLFNHVTQQNPGAVVTEYSWTATSCDPCPDTPLTPQELATLGADILSGSSGQDRFGGSGWTLTRMHHRYDAQGIDRDLVFRAAPAIIGGRGTPNADGELTEKHATGSSNINAFQGRYVMLHPWEGPVACTAPRRGIWGGPPGAGTPQPVSPPSALQPVEGAPAPVEPMINASDRAFLSVSAAPAVSPELGVLPAPRANATTRTIAPPASQSGCASCTASNASASPLALFACALFGAWFMRRRR